jgi:site-specific recombinase XerD
MVDWPRSDRRTGRRPQRGRRGRHARCCPPPTSVATSVAQSKGAPPVRCALSKSTTMALEKWIAAAGLKRTDYLFPGGARRVSRPMSARQFSRLLKSWVVEAGFDPTGYSVESLRRTKALHILRGTGDLQTVRALLGHVQIESTARYLGLKTKADPIVVCRAFDI